MRAWPIRSVTAVTDMTYGIDFSPASYDAETYASIGVLYRDDGWPPRCYHGGLTCDPVAKRMYLRVQYTAGYILPKDATAYEPRDLPYDLEALVWGIVQSQWQEMANGAGGLSAFSISDVAWTFDRSPREEWLRTISAYKRY